MTLIPELFTNGTLTAAQARSFADQDTFTPTLETQNGPNPNLGTDPVQTGLVWLNGNRATLDIRFVLGSNPSFSAAAGGIEITFPDAYLPRSSLGNFFTGTGHLIGGASGRVFLVTGFTNLANDRITLFVDNNEAQLARLIQGTPFTFTEGDALSFQASYLFDI